MGLERSTEAAAGADAGVVVIGTGPAGAAAAWTLQRAGISVTVLEAGDEQSASGLTVRAPGLTLFRKRRELPPPAKGAAEDSPDWYVELSAGGLSNHWTGTVPRFAPEDFSDGERLHEKHRWPISYADLASHYPAMERLLQIAGSGDDVLRLPGGEVSHRTLLASSWKPVVEQANARGHGVTSLPLSYGAAWTVTASGTPFNSFVRLLAPIPRSPRFQILFGARALRLEWSGERKRASRVIYRDAATGQERSMSAKAFVVAAGAVNSARLLLESQSADFPQGLGNTDGVLGRYMHDHPLAKLGIHLRRPLSIHPPAYLTRGPYQGSEPLRGVSNIQWSTTGSRARSIATLRPDRSTQIGFNLFGMLPPEERFGVDLRPGLRGAEGLAEVALRLSFDESTNRMLLRARDELLEILDAAGFGPSLALWHVENPGVSVHLGGTVRMHASPRYGMLDAWNRLHAVPNVLVVDAASFTTGPEKNPTLTAMALAARACDRLGRDLRG